MNAGSECRFAAVGFGARRALAGKKNFLKTFLPRQRLENHGERVGVFYKFAQGPKRLDINGEDCAVLPKTP